jgi:hypothetical protein
MGALIAARALRGERLLPVRSKRGRGDRSQCGAGRLSDASMSLAYVGCGDHHRCGRVRLPARSRVAPNHVTGPKARACRSLVAWASAARCVFTSAHPQPPRGGRSKRIPSVFSGERLSPGTSRVPSLPRSPSRHASVARTLGRWSFAGGTGPCSRRVRLLVPRQSVSPRRRSKALT